MHERSIYRNRPDFVKLSQKYPFFASFVTLDEKGNGNVDFKNPAALRALSKALLLQDFQLDINIPENVLVPTIPLRLNYILWLEDLLEIYNRESNDPVRGIDIGTGATAVYALMASKKNKWKMIGTDVDSFLLAIANENVQRNKMQEFVKIFQVKSENTLKDVLENLDSKVIYDFSMCNPPFFSSEQETVSLNKSRKEGRSSPTTSRTGETAQLYIEGGEVCIIKKMIEESKIYSERVRIFTSMIGIQKHEKIIEKELKANGIKNYAFTTFEQGKTTRWAVAWTFSKEKQLSQSQVLPIQLDFPVFPSEMSLESYILRLFSDIQLTPISRFTEDGIQLEVVAMSNTWTGQRKKRREQMRQQQQSSTDAKNGNGEPAAKKSKQDQMSSVLEQEPNVSSEPAVSFTVDLIHEGTKAKLIMQFCKGTLGKDAVNQIRQYLLNMYNKNISDTTTDLYKYSKT